MAGEGGRSCVLLGMTGKLSGKRLYPVSAVASAMLAQGRAPEFLMEADDNPWEREGRLLQLADGLPHTLCVRLSCASLSLSRCVGSAGGEVGGR